MNTNAEYYPLNDSRTLHHNFLNLLIFYDFEIKEPVSIHHSPLAPKRSDTACTDIPYALSIDFRISWQELPLEDIFGGARFLNRLEIVDQKLDRPRQEPNRIRIPSCPPWLSGRQSPTPPNRHRPTRWFAPFLHF